MNIDPMAEKYDAFSPYNYCVNDPVNKVDPDGMETDDPYYNKENLMVTTIYCKEAKELVRYDWQMGFNPNWDGGGSSESGFEIDLIIVGEYDVPFIYKDEQGNIIADYSHNGEPSYNDWMGIDDEDITEKAANSEGVDGLDNILFAVSMGKQGGDKAVQYFQMSNKGILRAAVNNDIPTDRIKDIMRSTGKVGTGLKVVGVLGNVASAGHTMYKISQDGMSVQYGADLVFNAIAFVPGWGWVVSGVYFGGQAIMESEGFKAIQQEWREKYPITGAPPHMMGHCFVEGTQVLMKDFSLCNIENIVVGDTVKTFNFRTSQLENNRVLKISAPIHNDLVTISFTNDIKNINTEDHPYYVKGKGWCSYKPELTFQRYGLEALQLKEGDICYYYKGGELMEIKIVEFISLNSEVKTYNLTEIENSNNYFANGFLIHNESENLKNTSKVPLNKNGQRVMFKPLEIKE